MADTIVVRTNLPDFRAQLRALSERVEGKLVTRALRAAGRVFRDSARRKVPILRAPDARRRAGAIQRAIYVGRSRESRKGTPVYVVSVRATGGQTKRGIDPFYWRFLEGGWTPRGRGRGLRGGHRAKAVQRQRVLKAGGRKVSYPFLKPAFDADGGRAVDAFVQTLTQGLEEENRGRL